MHDHLRVRTVLAPAYAQPDGMDGTSSAGDAAGGSAALPPPPVLVQTLLGSYIQVGARALDVRTWDVWRRTGMRLSSVVHVRPAALIAIGTHSGGALAS